MITTKCFDLNRVQEQAKIIKKDYEEVVSISYIWNYQILHNSAHNNNNNNNCNISVKIVALEKSRNEDYEWNKRSQYSKAKRFI